MYAMHRSYLLISCNLIFLLFSLKVNIVNVSKKFRGGVGGGG